MPHNESVSLLFTLFFFFIKTFVCLFVCVGVGGPEGKVLLCFKWCVWIRISCEFVSEMAWNCAPTIERICHCIHHSSVRADSALVGVDIGPSQSRMVSLIPSFISSRQWRRCFGGCVGGARFHRLSKRSIRQVPSLSGRVRKQRRREIDLTDAISRFPIRSGRHPIALTWN